MLSLRERFEGLENGGGYEKGKTRANFDLHFSHAYNLHPPTPTFFTPLAVADEEVTAATAPPPTKCEFDLGRVACCVYKRFGGLDNRIGYEKGKKTDI